MIEWDTSDWVIPGNVVLSTQEPLELRLFEGLDAEIERIIRAVTTVRSEAYRLQCVVDVDLTERLTPETIVWSDWNGITGGLAINWDSFCVGLDVYGIDIEHDQNRAEIKLTEQSTGDIATFKSMCEVFAFFDDYVKWWADND